MWLCDFLVSISNIAINRKSIVCLWQMNSGIFKIEMVLPDNHSANTPFVFFCGQQNSFLGDTCTRVPHDPREPSFQTCVASLPPSSDTLCLHDQHLYTTKTCPRRFPGWCVSNEYSHVIFESSSQSMT